MYGFIILISFVLFGFMFYKYPTVSTYKLIISFVVFLLGFYFILYNPILEGYENKILNDDYFNKHCPNVLIQKGDEFFLYNSHRAKIPGVNPLKFNNLNEYTEFLEWQRSQNIKCPILYLQHSYDAQGNEVYKGRQSPTELNGGLPNFEMNSRNSDTDPANTVEGKSLLLDAGIDDPPFNQGNIPAYDQQNQYIGLETPLDKLYNENNLVAPNPVGKNRQEQPFSE